MADARAVAKGQGDLGMLQEVVVPRHFDLVTSGHISMCWRFAGITILEGHTSHPDFSAWRRDGLLIKALDLAQTLMNTI